MQEVCNSGNARIKIPRRILKGVDPFLFNGSFVSNKKQDTSVLCLCMKEHQIQNTHKVTHGVQDLQMFADAQKGPQSKVYFKTNHMYYILYI